MLEYDFFFFFFLRAPSPAFYKNYISLAGLDNLIEH